jgi:hypothetical protein
MASERGAPAADDFVPVLVYVLIKVCIAILTDCFLSYTSSKLQGVVLTWLRGLSFTVEKLKESSCITYVDKILRYIFLKYKPNFSQLSSQNGLF